MPKLTERALATIEGLDLSLLDQQLHLLHIVEASDAVLREHRDALTGVLNFLSQLYNELAEDGL